MRNMINYDAFDFYTFVADDIGLITIDDCMSIASKYMVIAEKDINPKVMIRYYGYGETEEEAELDCEKTIEDYLFPD